MGNQNCSKCCRADLAKEEVDLKLSNNFVQYSSQNSKDTLLSEHRFVQSPMNNIPEQHIIYTDNHIQMAYKIQALWRGYLDRKHFNFLKSYSFPKHQYFCKNEQLQTLSHKKINFPIEYSLETRAFNYQSGASYTGE